MNEEIKDEEIQKKKKNWFFSMSKFEQIFWITIGILMLSYTTLVLLAHFNTEKKSKKITQEIRKPIISKWITQLIPSDKMKKNIIEKIDDIHQNLEIEKTKVNETINSEFDKLFKDVDGNVDAFLDFHYSIIGEYTELTTMVAGDIEKEISEKLFDSNFSNQIEKTSLLIDETYRNSITEHFKVIDNTALQDIDLDLNRGTLSKLNEDIRLRMSTQEGKIGIMLSARLAPQAIKIITAKLATKTVAKVAAKSAAKTTAKVAASSTAGTAGLTCGPFAWICSPIAAGVAWFATDAVVIAGDEYLNREEFKKKILNSLHEQRDLLKENYRKSYTEAFDKFSKNLIEQYKNTPILEKKRVRIKDIISN